MKNQRFDLSVKLLQAILWQYNDAANLISLLGQKQAWYDARQTGFWTDWIRDVFDLRTANEFGFVVWSIILGVPLSVVLEPDYLSKPVFGFGPSYRVNFNRGNFAVRNQTTINLTVEQRRLVLQLRYFQLISRGTVPQTNAFLKRIFADYGPVYVLDPLNMGEIVYVFGFALPSALQFVLTYYDLLPRPAACGVRYIVIGLERWGFGTYHRNFERGNFGGS